MVRLFYWNDKPNVGDHYARWLAEKLYKNVRYDQLMPNLAITGSILEFKNLTNDTIVFGAGLHKINEQNFCRITDKNNFLAVRGKLTAKELNLDKDAVLGDTGLLASKFYAPEYCAKKKKYCFITHHSEYDSIKELLGNNIDVYSAGTNDVEKFIDILNNYEIIFSSSLHGIIFAHSYGIPAIHIEYINISGEENFKFKDYFSILDIKYTKYNIDSNIENCINLFDQLYLKKQKFCPTIETIQNIQNSLLKVCPKEQDLNKTYNTAICAFAKKENLYINNWINYHLNLGFERIYIFDNNDSKCEYVGNCIENINNVVIFSLNDLHRQHMQLDYCEIFYNTYKDYFSWCAFIDIDEFFCGFSNVNKFLDDEKFTNYNAILVKWRLFDDNNTIERDLSIPVQNYFTHITKLANDWYSNLCKCIVRGHIQEEIAGFCHFVYYKGSCIEKDTPRNLSMNKNLKTLEACLPSGKKCTETICLANCYSDEIVFLNHYITKSLQEFLMQKFGGGDAIIEDKVRSMAYYWLVNNKTQEKQQYALDYVKNNFKGEELQQMIMLVLK